MTEIFIHKTKETILKNLGDEKFGVGDLASEMGFSRSQILRKVKAATGKSVNQFIREIRLEEAEKLLRNNELTISEIAYQVGFSSPSYFNRCFLNYFRVTPGEYKKQVEQKGVVELHAKHDGLLTKLKLNRIWLGVFLLLIILGGLLSVLRSEKGEENAELRQSSVAVLPLLDLSENRDKEYLAAGITEAITLELSRNESIRVISRGSTMRYKGGEKLYSEIARELGVDLLLEGSVLYGNDSLRVVVQLIEPFPKEKHIWANSYDQDNSNILELVRNVSNEIAGEISSVVEPEESIRSLHKIDPEAYEFYLRGRHLYNTQKTRYHSLLKAIDYLNDAVKEDPKFAQAYVTLAETYLAINTLISDNKEKTSYRERAKQMVDKAFELDQSLAEAYITKGNLVGKFDWDWEQMKILAEKGLKIDPNNVNAYLILSNYYTIMGDYRKAIHEASIAESLDPLNPTVGCLVAERYYIAGDYEQSIKKFNEVLELNPNYGFAYHGIGYAYLKSGNRQKSLESWLTLQGIMGNDSLAWYYTHKTFEDGLHFYLRQVKKKTPVFCSNPMIVSSVYMMVNDEPGALEYLNIAYQYKNEDMPVMLAYPDFYPLYDNQEFQEIAGEIGVIFPD